MNLSGLGKSMWVSIVLLIVSIVLYGSFRAGLTPFSELELWGTITGIWSVWWAALNHPYNWVIGLVNEAIFFLMFWQYGLYANAWLQVFFAVISLYGWVYWLMGGKKRTEAPITYTGLQNVLVLSLMTGLLTIILVKVLELTTGNYAPLDALTTAISIMATFLLAKRKVENWLFWFVADMIYIPYLASQGLYLTSALYVLFALICVKGLYDWRTIEKGQAK